jgi:hypothetical protein
MISRAAASYPPTNGCASPLVYYGGAIISRPAVVQVSWNVPFTNGTVPSSVESYLASWWPAILSPQAGYLAWLSEYDTAALLGQDGLAGSNQSFAGFGAYVGLFHISPATANQGAAVTDTQIAAELVAQIEAGHLPAPTFDATGSCNTVYMIDFPPSVTDLSFTLAGSTAHSCTDFCGYHGGTRYQGKNIYYGVHPDFSSACPACAPDGLQPDLGLVHSHELAEAMTDPEIGFEPLTATSTDFVRPGGWDQIATGCSEIGDSCAWPSTIPTVTYQGQAFYVQGLFDNARMDCETAGQTPQCTTSAQCSSATPICDATSHACRACVASDCAGATPICDATGGACRACVATDCTGATAVCDATSGQCVQCDANDHSACVTPTGMCDATTHACRGCLSNSDCSTSTNHVCDASTGACVACMSDSDCASHACDTSRNVCVQCNADSECSNPTPVCDATAPAGSGLDTCRPCRSDGECSANTHGHACSTGGSCVQCTATNHAACPSGSTCNPTTETCEAAGLDGGSGAHDGGGWLDGGSTGSLDAGSSHDSGSVSEADGAVHEESDGGRAGTGSSDAAADGPGAGQGGGGGGCSVSRSSQPPSLPAAIGLLLGLALLARRREQA